VRIEWAQEAGVAGRVPRLFRNTGPGRQHIHSSNGLEIRPWSTWTVPTSMREVESAVRLVIGRRSLPHGTLFLASPPRRTMRRYHEQDAGKAASGPSQAACGPMVPGHWLTFRILSVAARAYRPLGAQPLSTHPGVRVARQCETSPLAARWNSLPAHAPYDDG
jgi:ribosomal protein L32